MPAEIRELGSQGSSNLLARYITQERHRQTGRTCHFAARRLLIRPASLTAVQQEVLAAAFPEMTGLVGLVSSFEGPLPTAQDKEDIF